MPTFQEVRGGFGTLLWSHIAAKNSEEHINHIRRYVNQESIATFPCFRRPMNASQKAVEDAHAGWHIFPFTVGTSAD